MQMTEIRRHSYAATVKIDDVLSSLADEAKELFGYDVLAQKVATLESEETALQSAMKRLDIEILNRSDVLSYKKERMVERSAERFKDWAKEISTKERIYSFDGFRGSAWIRRKLEEYKQPIPEFVLAKAVQIRRAVPDCMIWVESLEDHPDPFLVVTAPDAKNEWDDPAETYYVEVWGEPKFEGRL